MKSDAFNGKPYPMTMETNNRFEKALEALNALKQDGSYEGRCSAAMQALDGFMMTGASDSAVAAVESMGAQYNHMLSKAATDSTELIGRMEETCRALCEEETEQIFARLRNHEEKLPEVEIRAMRKHRDWFAPRLLAETLSNIETLEQIIKNAPIDNPDEPASSSFDSSLPFFALFLFSEWEMVESVPVVMRGSHLPGDGPFDLFGDAVHEQLPRYIGLMLPDDLDRIDELIANPDLNPFVRWSSASSYKYLVRDGRISLFDATARLEQLFERTKIRGTDGKPGIGHEYEVSSGLLSVIEEMGATPLMKVAPADLEWAFVDQSIISRNELSFDLTAGDDGMVGDALQDLPPTRTEDFLVSLRFWAPFDDERQVVRSTTPPTEPKAVRVDLGARPVPMPAFAQQPDMQATQLHRPERTPRNARCPCGSGKKYKQCCMRTSSNT